MLVHFNNEKFLLSQAVTVNNLSKVGLTTTINLTAEQLKNGIAF